MQPRIRKLSIVCIYLNVDNSHQMNGNQSILHRPREVKYRKETRGVYMDPLGGEI